MHQIQLYAALHIEIIIAYERLARRRPGRDGAPQQAKVGGDLGVAEKIRLDHARQCAPQEGVSQSRPTATPTLIYTDELNGDLLLGRVGGPIVLGGGGRGSIFSLERRSVRLWKAWFMGRKGG